MYWKEQVADYLGVSTPAVNKWEKGSCYPDITILPALARLLRVDLNTLLSFKEELSEQEIGKFANDLVNIINTKGFDAAFEKAMDKIHEYPTCHKLILTIATVLQGAIYMFGIENKDNYEKQIESLYVRVEDSDELEVKSQAISMLINKYLEREDYKKAEEYINKLPDITYDKKLLKGNFYTKSGDFEKAWKVFEKKLISATTDIVNTLMSMMEIALKEKRYEDAKYFTEVLEKTVKLYDLWDYNTYAGYLQLYIAQKDSDNFIAVLKNMLDSMSKKWNPSKSKLYSHIKTRENEEGFNKQLLSNFINMIKSSINDELSFLKGNKELDELLNKEI